MVATFLLLEAFANDFKLFFVDLFRRLLYSGLGLLFVL